MDVWVGRLIEGWIYILNGEMDLQMIKKEKGIDK